MSAQHHHDPAHPAAPDYEHTGHGPEQSLDHTSHGHHPDADTHGQAMPSDHAHSAVDDDHAVHTHGEHAGHSTAMFKNKFWLSLVLAIPEIGRAHV